MVWIHSFPSIYTHTKVTNKITENTEKEHLHYTFLKLFCVKSTDYEMDFNWLTK